MAPATQPPAAAGTRTYDCPKCGHVLRVFGRDRHRIYFATGDGLLDDPVMNRACPDCGRALPGKAGGSKP